MKAHKHAAQMAEYAKDAFETERPWRRWEVAGLSGNFGDLTEHPLWDCNMQYRRKPPTININGFEVPEPLREAPPLNTVVYLPSPSLEELVFPLHWREVHDSTIQLQRGIIHSSREAAVIHARALLSFTAREQKEGA